MAATNPIPVRLDDGTIQRLKAAADRMGTKKATLMRFLVKTFIDHFEINGLGSLPHDWKEIMHALDGRTYGQLRSLPSAEETKETKPLPKTVRVVYPPAPKPTRRKKRTP